MLCTPVSSWQDCALAVKKAIKNANTPAEAFEAGAEWSKKYSQLFDKSAPPEWPPSDRKRLEKGVETAYEEIVGQYLDPASVALGLAIKKYFPTLSAILEFSFPPVATALYVILAPSPLVTEFSEAKSANEGIGNELIKKLDTFLPVNWRNEYSSRVQIVVDEIQKPTIP
jgi:hypothetical protein